MESFTESIKSRLNKWSTSFLGDVTPADTTNAALSVQLKTELSH
jgi:hypothetical protein